MKNKELFNRTISILVNAYHNNTLQHGYCSACAVGNLVAAGINTEAKKSGTEFQNGVLAVWDRVFMTTDRGQYFEIDKYEGEAKEQIDSTGYSVEDLAKIEYAFENVPMPAHCTLYTGDDDEWMFSGLMAVVDALMLIHEADNSEIEEAKLLFVK